MIPVRRLMAAVARHFLPLLRMATRGVAIQATEAPLPEQTEFDFSTVHGPRLSGALSPVASAVQDQPRVSGRLARLWAQINQSKRRLERARQQLQALVEQLDGEMAGDRSAVAASLTALTEKLLDHFERRSLAQWQRLELAIWILDNIESLEQFGHYTHALKTRYQTLCSQFYGQQEAAAIDSDRLAGVVADLDGESPYRARQHDGAGHAPGDDRAASPRDSRPAAESPVQAGSDAAAQPISQRLITRLFRRTARVLHPDLAANEQSRERNGALMKTLLQARRDNDIATLCALYMEHAGGLELGADHDEIEQLQTMLEQQLAALELELQTLSGPSPLHQWVCDRLLHKSADQQRQAIAAMRAELREVARQAQQLKHRVRTLAGLKPLLAERHDARLVSSAF